MTDVSKRRFQEWEALRALKRLNEKTSALAALKQPSKWSSWLSAFWLPAGYAIGLILSEMSDGERWMRIVVGCLITSVFVLAIEHVRLKRRLDAAVTLLKLRDEA